jgi:RNA polymerase primary sigma factor
MTSWRVPTPRGASPPAGTAERLTGRQERDLVIATEAGDPEACRCLVDAFLPQIAALARQFPPGRGVGRGELVQEGVAGLLFAARRYDPALQTPFWGYASFWVRKSMQELVAELTRPVALSDRAVRGLAAVRAARRDHLQAHGVDPTTEQLSRATGLHRTQVADLQATERVPRSFDEPAGPEGMSTDAVGDRIADPAAEQAYDVVLEEIERREVLDLTEQLSDRERAVVRAHYGLGEPAQTLTRIGGTLGVSAERVRQIEGGALAKLRAALAQPAVVAGRRP